MKSNVVHMTLVNESVTFTKRGVWIQPLLSDGFWFGGSVIELFSIMIYHKDLDIDNARFYVRPDYRN
jgi:hypothetical protein